LIMKILQIKKKKIGIFVLQKLYSIFLLGLFLYFILQKTFEKIILIKNEFKTILLNRKKNV